MVEKYSVYLETTIPSFLSSRPSKNLIVAGRQEITHQWWQSRRDMYRLFISQFVLDEILCGDIEAAQRRMDTIKDIDLLEVDNEVLSLTQSIVRAGIIPIKSSTDAAHIAIAARHGIDFLLTWNCNHIANAELLRKINHVVSESGYILPTICTPDELFGERDDER